MASLRVSFFSHTFSESLFFFKLYAPNKGCLIFNGIDIEPFQYCCDTNFTLNPIHLKIWKFNSFLNNILQRQEGRYIIRVLYNVILHLIVYSY